MHREFHRNFTTKNFERIWKQFVAMFNVNIHIDSIFFDTILCHTGVKFKSMPVIVNMYLNVHECHACFLAKICLCVVFKDADKGNFKPFAIC